MTDTQSPLDSNDLLGGALECPMCGAKDAFAIDPNDESRGYCSAENRTWVVRETLYMESLRLFQAIEKLHVSTEQTEVRARALDLCNKLREFRL